MPILAKLCENPLNPVDEQEYTPGFGYRFTPNTNLDGRAMPAEDKLDEKSSKS